MAQRRMFSQRIVGDENFLEMPQSTQNLYFHLGIYADDDGFVNPKKIVRMIGANPDDIKVLTTKGFVIPFETGVVVVTHWKENNYIQKDRYTPTIYQDEVKQLGCIQNVYKLDTQVRLGKVRLGKSKDNTISKDIEVTPKVEYGNSDINWLLEEFKNSMGFKSSGSKDRMLAKHLLNNFTKEQIVTMLKYCSTDEYAPRIGSVEKLWYKRGDVVAGLKSKFNKKSNMTII